ncbi:uncharacterized protein BXZ73DRAFT_55888 [Epithele typhae]|uniref:uncharacterized protein n=1 Tax=Epithele typhae TaxID=378194 RepID=UPI002007E2AC|nr:uncharacterized protein BXZ73DRAFT_55888 [Epithele typhae]KAH9912776.1 hypothetical protein BXZ73DRAFT_55888 [Epithele typhae]
MSFSKARGASLHRSTEVRERGLHSGGPTRHPDYYLEDGNLVILVEKTLFRVFRSTFTRHSPVFRDLFSLPNPEGSTSEGMDDANPVQLSGISPVDFERLLWVLYPLNYAHPRAGTLAEWTSILSLATRWEFSSVRTLAIHHIQSLPSAFASPLSPPTPSPVSTSPDRRPSKATSTPVFPLDAILLARAYDLPRDRWLLSAYTALCTRPAPLTSAEAAGLGAEDTSRVARVREALRAREAGSRLGGYCAPTVSSAARARLSAGAGTVTGGRGVLDWSGSGRGATPAPRPATVLGTRASPFAKGSPPSTSRSPTAFPGPARLVAETFEISCL